VIKGLRETRRRGKGEMRMKLDICKTLIPAVVIMVAGCGNLAEPSGFSFATQTGVPPNTNIQSNVVTIKGNQFPASISFANASSAQYSQYSINGGAFTAGQSGDRLSPGNTLQLQQTTAGTKNTTRTTTITVGGLTTTFTTVTSSSGGTVSAGPNANGNTVTISSIAASLSAANNVVHYTITGDTNFSTTNTSGISGNTIPVAFTLQAISNTGQLVYSTNATQVQIPFGEQMVALLSGSLPTIVSGNLPTAVLGYPITTMNYWSGLISYWQIVPGSLTLQQ
jgi:hypothetical protein